MDKEHSRTTDDMTTATSAADSYIGSFISVISKSEIRYEGVLYHLDTRNSTLGLRNVRSYGTEGRKRDGPQVPPSERIYEYILFRGTDIKDLDVKPGPRARLEESIHNDPAIIQSDSYYGAPSSLNSVTAGNRPLLGANLNSEPSLLNSRAVSNLGLSDSSQLTNSSFSPHGSQRQWPDYSGGLGGGISSLHQHITSSTSMLYPLHNEEPSTVGVKKLSTVVSPKHSYGQSSAMPPNYTTPVSSEQFPAPLIDSIFSDSPLPFHNPTSSNLSTRSIKNQVPLLSFVPADSARHAIPPILDPTLDPFLRQNPPLPFLDQLSQPKLSEQNLNEVGITGSISPKLIPSSTISFAALQSPLLPPTSEKLPSSEFTEEFDFQAMNEKFKKDEIWGYLGKANYDERASNLDSGDTNSPDSADKTETTSAYKKDEFFDTISRNTIGWNNNGHNRYSERTQFVSQAFGNFQRSDQFGYNGYGDGRGGPYGAAYNWGGGYHDAYRGRGGYYRQR